MKLALSRLMFLGAMLLVVAAADALKNAGIEYPELQALAAAGIATVLTMVVCG